MWILWDVDFCCNVGWLLLFIVPPLCSYTKSINGCHFWLSIKGLPKCWRILLSWRAWLYSIEDVAESHAFLNTLWWAAQWGIYCQLLLRLRIVKMDWKTLAISSFTQDQVKLKVTGEVLYNLDWILQSQIDIFRNQRPILIIKKWGSYF